MYLVVFVGEFRHKFYTQMEDPGICLAPTNLLGYPQLPSLKRKKIRPNFGPSLAVKVSGRVLFFFKFPFKT